MDAMQAKAHTKTQKKHTKTQTNKQTTSTPTMATSCYNPSLALVTQHSTLEDDPTKEPETQVKESNGIKHLVSESHHLVKFRFIPSLTMTFLCRRATT